MDDDQSNSDVFYIRWYLIRKTKREFKEFSIPIETFDIEFVV